MKAEGTRTSTVGRRGGSAAAPTLSPACPGPLFADPGDLGACAVASPPRTARAGSPRNSLPAARPVPVDGDTVDFPAALPTFWHTLRHAIRRVLVALNGGALNGLVGTEQHEWKGKNPRTTRPTEGPGLRHARRGGDTEVADTPARIASARMPAGPSVGPHLQSTSDRRRTPFEFTAIPVTPLLRLGPGGEFVYDIWGGV